MKVAIKKPAPAGTGFERQVFVLIGMMRSGSNLLERQLGLLPDVRCHGELYNPAFVGLDVAQGKEQAGYKRDSIEARNADPMGLLTKLDAACDRPVMGLRLFLDHSEPMTARLLYDKSVKKIVLSRNLLESYVSLLIAQKTDQWISTKEAVKPSDPVEVDVPKFINYALRQSLFYNDILTVLHQTGQDYRMVDYTGLNDLALLNKLAKFIGSKHQALQVEEPLKKQNPGTLAEKVIDYPKVVEALKKRRMMRWFAGA